MKPTWRLGCGAMTVIGGICGGVLVLVGPAWLGFLVQAIVLVSAGVLNLVLPNPLESNSADSEDPPDDVRPSISGSDPNDG